jgi:hypothetical protein
MTETERTKLVEILDSIMVLFEKVKAGATLDRDDLAHTKTLIGKMGSNVG